MTDEGRDLDDPFDLPMQPTGSGVADLETARELDAISSDLPPIEATAEVAAEIDALRPTLTDDATGESSAHPS